MFARQLFAGAAAIMCATALTAAQTPATGASPQVPPARQNAPTIAEPRSEQKATPQASTTERASGDQSPIKLEGCLVRQQDIPGQPPADADKAGRMNDYILISSASQPTAVGTSGSNTPAAVGSEAKPTMNLGAMYKVKGTSEMQLQQLAGKRVSVSGQIEAAVNQKAATASTPAVGTGSQTQSGTDANNGFGDEKTAYRTIAASSINEVSGSCAALPKSSDR
jgi:hypothetical protein